MAVQWTEVAPEPKARPQPKLDASKMLRNCRARVIATHLAQQKRDGIRLYRPLPNMEAFHASGAHWRLVDGSNRAGKTLAVCAEIARAVLGCDPYEKYPKRNGRVLIVGKGVPHLANPIWQTLGKPGAFQTIRDRETGLWRAVRWRTDDPTQLDPDDVARKKEWRPSEPLIPERMIVGGYDGIAWEERKTGVPKQVNLRTGWEIWFRTGNSSPPQGIQLDIGWFDEEFENHQYYPEVNARLVDRSGVGIWSATPDIAAPQLGELREKADAGVPGIEAFSIFIADNPFLSADDKQTFFNALTSDEQREIKYYGRYTLFGRRPYQCYRPDGAHGCEPFDIPEDWCRWCIVDPARQRCGTLLLAIDPDEEHVWIYDAYPLKAADANRWAETVAERQGEWKFEAFVMDKRMGRETPVGQGHSSVAKQYWDALQERKVTPRTMGPMHGFFEGSDNIMFREEALLDWMRIRESGPFVGTAKLQVFKTVCPELHSEIKAAYYDRKRPDKRVKLPNSDLLDALEYAASINPRYYAPEKIPDPQRRPAEVAWERKQEYIANRRRRSRMAFV